MQMNATNTNTEPAGGMTPAGNEGTTPLPSLLPPPSEPPRQRADQDQSMANDISATKQLVNAIMGDGGIRQKLLKRGFDTQKLSAA